MAQQQNFKTIVFRVDANAIIGVGHAMRCLALMQVLANTKHVQLSLLSFEMPENLIAQAKSYGVSIKFLAQNDDDKTVIVHYQQNTASLMIIDGYHITDELMAQYQKSGLQLALFDDVNDRSTLNADIIINACPDALQLNYPNTSTAKCLLGLDYAMLNPALADIPHKNFNQRTALTLCFGGSDVAGLTKKVVDKLSHIKPEKFGLKVQVITGKLVRDLDEISQLCLTNGFAHYIQPTNLGELLSQSRLAIAAPGNLVYELAYFNVPSVLLTVAENQKLSAKFHQDKGWAKTFDGLNETSLLAAINFLSSCLAKPSLLDEMHEKSLGLIDGKGATRLTKQLLEIVDVH